MKSKRITYEEALEYLYGLQKYGIKFGLNKTSNLLKAFGNPHRGPRYVHIAGTNGKGSVAAMLESVLIRAGLKVGFYSSPHLTRFTERFRINGKEMPPEEAAGILGELRDVIGRKEPPTFFEATTAMALVYFARNRTDLAIMEVGMGGRLDATNVIRPLVSAITNISLEHQAFLGTRLRAIAGEKAGIVKQGVDLVTAARQDSVLEVLRATCRERRAPFWKVGKDVRYRWTQEGFHYYGLRRRFKGLELALAGRFQGRNAALALAVLELLEGKGIRIESEHVTQGLRETAWPGRMQVISTRPLIVLDGGHNPAAMRLLAGSIPGAFLYGRLIVVLGIMDDKDIGGMLRGIVPLADYVLYTRPVYARAARPERLMREAAFLKKPGEIVPLLSEALDKAQEMAHPDDMILICGSLFTVGEALSYFEPEKYRPDGL